MVLPLGCFFSKHYIDLSQSNFIAILHMKQMEPAGVQSLLCCEVEDKIV